MLIAARVLQAIGGSMLNPVAMSIIRNVFEDPRERAQAIGVWGGVIGISMALGPVVGGALVDSVGWRSVFLVNVPVGITAIVLTALFVPESRAAHPRRFDPLGQLAVIVALSTLTYAIIEGPGNGWLSAQTLILFAVSLIAFTFLIAYELRRDQPLIEIRFFRSAPFSGASAIAVLRVRGPRRIPVPQHPLPPRGPRAVALSRRPVHAADGADDDRDRAPLSGRFVGNRGSRRLPLVGGGLGLIASASILTQLSATTPFSVLIISYVLFGIGHRAGQPADHQHRRLRACRRRRPGVAAAIASTSRQVGQTLGVAVLGALAPAARWSRDRRLVRRGDPRQLVDHGRDSGSWCS